MQELKIRIKRVRKGDTETKVVFAEALAQGEVPEDGYIVLREGSHGLPLYIRESDLEEARMATSGKGLPVWIDAKSWKG